MTRYWRAWRGGNAELVRWACEPDEPSRLFGLLHEDIEVDRRGFPAPDVTLAVRGRDAVERLFRRIWGTWDHYSLELVRVVDAGDEVVVTMHERARGRGSGAPFERVWTQVWTFHDGRLVGWRPYAEEADTLESVGLPTGNVETFRRYHEVINETGEIPLELFHPEIPLHRRTDRPNRGLSGAQRGPEAPDLSDEAA